MKRNSFLAYIPIPFYVSIFKTPNIFPVFSHLYLNLQPANRHGDTSFMKPHFHGSVFFKVQHLCSLCALATRGLKSEPGNDTYRAPRRLHQQAQVPGRTAPSVRTLTRDRVSVVPKLRATFNDRVK